MHSRHQQFLTAFSAVCLSPASPNPYLRITKLIQQVSGKIVVLNGFPAAGKLTILENVLARLPKGKAHLMDNHKLIDPAAALYLPIPTLSRPRPGALQPASQDARALLLAY